MKDWLPGQDDLSKPVDDIIQNLEPLISKPIYADDLKNAINKVAKKNGINLPKDEIDQLAKKVMVLNSIPRDKLRPSLDIVNETLSPR